MLKMDSQLSNTAYSSVYCSHNFCQHVYHVPSTYISHNWKPWGLRW